MYTGGLLSQGDEKMTRNIKIDLSKKSERIHAIMAEMVI